MKNLCLVKNFILYYMFFINIFFTMSNLVIRVEMLLLYESLDTFCKASIVYLIIENNIFSSYNNV